MPSAESVAFYLGVRNDVSGIGAEQFNNTIFFGSDGRLQGTIDMGNLQNLSSDPMDPDFSFTLGTMSHELMHRWAAFVKVRSPNGQITNDLLGQENSHWSFLLDTKGSLMYGNSWQDNGNGTFTSLKGRKYYSPLDLYLMGLIDKTDVPPMRLIDSPATDKTQVSKPGITISGSSHFVTIDDIIAAEGERSPDHTLSQKNFKVGCIYITRAGTFSEKSLSAIRSIMNNWVVWHSGLTNGKSSVEFLQNPLEALAHNPGPVTPPNTPRPTPAEVQDAVNWLISQQHEDGHWGDPGTTGEKDTAAALHALKLFSDARTSIANGLSWVTKNGIPNSTDYLSRFIESLSLNSASVSNLLTEINARQNSDGAWGPARGYLSSPTDTALVLRAWTTAGQFDNPLVSRVIEYLKAKQNPNGGWGGSPQVSDIQTTANVLIAFSPLRVSHELSQEVQQGLFWLNSQQKEDGGFGEESSTIYDTAAVLMVLKLYAGAPDYFGPAIQYLQNRQSANGSWHDSVFETAVAAEALQTWKDSVDADLVVNSADISFFPRTISHTPENETIDVLVQNKGLANANAFRVVLYENSITAANMLAQQTLSLGGQSTATVRFTATFNDTRDHRLFIVADPDNVVIETHETNNVAIAILSNDLNMDPDLQVFTDRMSFTPVAINQIPADITLEAQVLNAGKSDVSAATVALYQDTISESTKVGERQIAVGAQSSVTVVFPFTVIDGESHNYILVADPAGLVPERNEYNNTAIKLLTSNPTYDFSIGAHDLALSTTTAEMGQPVTITAHIRNNGNRDGFNVPVRFFIVKEAVEYDIATLNFDLPAGGQIDRQVIWNADRPGNDMHVWAQVDPFNAFVEASEVNNAASVLLTVNPYPDPNLTLTYKDISITPSPAYEGQSAVISARIWNNGGGPATNIKVDFSWNQAGEPPTFLGSRTIATLNPDQSTDVVWNLEPLAIAGKRQISVVVDPDNAIKEISESDNSAFKELEIQTLPDFIVSPASITFNPSAPAEGVSVNITVVVQNAGGQTGANVPIVLMEEGQQIASQTIASVPGNSQASTSFSYNTSGKAGARRLQIVVDPAHAIAEQRTDNNSAERVLGVQNGNLWLSQRYISADSKGEQTSTTFFFRLDQATDVKVVVVNARDRVVRNFTGPELAHTTGASITWDGRNDRGQLVADGDYQIQVRDLLGNILVALPVTVDNNLSPLALAAGTAFLSKNNLTCMLPDLAQWQWFADESGIIFSVEVDEDTPEYPAGIYTMAPDGQDITRIVPWEWSSSTEYYYSGYGSSSTFYLAPDSVHVGFILRKSSPDGSNIQYKLYTMNRFGEDLTMIDSVDYRLDRSYVWDRIHEMYWSPDGEWLAYWVGHNQNNSEEREIILVRRDGSAKTALPMIQERLVTDVQWSPDGKLLLYAATDYHWNSSDFATFFVADTTGASHAIFELNGELRSIQWIDSNTLVVVYHDGTQNQDGVKILDAIDNRNHSQTTWLGETDSVLSPPIIAPARDGFAFIRQHAVDSDSKGWKEGDGYWSVQYCTPQAQCRALHQARAFPNATSLSDLQWSNQGDRLVFVDWVNQTLSQCEYRPGLVVMDPVSGEKTVFPVNGTINPCSSGPAPYSFHVWSQQNGLWVEQGVMHFGSSFGTQTLSLPGFSADADGNGILRLTQVGADEARLNYVALGANGQTYAPVKSTDLTAVSDLLSQILRLDGTSADVTGHTLEVNWAKLPSKQTFSLQLNAREIVNGGASSQDSGTGTATNGTTPPLEGLTLPGQDTLRWMADDDWLFGVAQTGYSPNPDESYPYFALDAYSGKPTYFPLEADEGFTTQLSPHSRYLTYEKWAQEESTCYGRGNFDLWAMRSLLNLTADLKIVRKPSCLELRGTATDLNFDHYQLEYADLSSPGTWAQVQPPKDRMVVDDLLAQWVPPRPGAYAVRLTVTDKAGHVAVKQRRITWGLQSPMVNLFLDEEFMSPNGDGVSDTLNLHYTVLEPIHLEFYIYSQSDNRLVATLYRDYASPPGPDGRDSISWNGRDLNGQIAPDGRYRLEVLDNAFEFVLDRTPPKVAFELGKIEIESSCSNGEACIIPTKITAPLKGFVIDDNLKQWMIEIGRGDNPTEWQEFAHGSGTYGEVKDGRIESETIHELNVTQIAQAAGCKFRIIAEDQAGNKTVAASEVMEELAVVYQWADPLKINASMYTIPLDRKEDGSFLVHWLDPMPISYLNTDTHLLKALLTLKKPVVQLTLQYRRGAQWQDGPQIQNPVAAQDNFQFAGRIPNLETVNAVQLKAVDTAGKVFYSNPVPTQKIFRLGCIDPDSKLLVSSVYLFEDLTYLALKWEGTDQNRNTVDGVIKSYDAAKGDAIPTGSVPWVPGTKPDNAKYVLSAIGVSGELYEDRDPQPEFCESSSDLPGPETKDDSFLVITRPLGRCGLQPGAISITATPQFLTGQAGYYTIDKTMPLKRLTYYLYASRSWQQLQSYDLTTGPLGGVEINAFARNNQGQYLLPEGKYRVKAVLETLDGQVFEIDQERVPSLTPAIVQKITAEIFIDRTAPLARITSPQPGAMICPNRTWLDQSGKQHFGIDVAALVQDNLQSGFFSSAPNLPGAGRYFINYAYSPAPQESEWFTGGFRDETSIQGNGTQSSLLGVWDLTGITQDEITMRLMVDDGSGNMTCHEQQVRIDQVHPLSAVADTKLFSPNGDGTLDQVNLNVSIDESVTLAVAVMRADRSVLKTLAAAVSHPGGPVSFAWDGTDDGGRPAPDGSYTIVVTSTDACSNAQKIEIKDIELDRTPPTVQISYPQSGSSLGVVVEVTGTADDKNFGGYRLVLLDESSNAPLSVLGSSAFKVTNAVLGRWNTFGAEGMRVIQLIGWDKAGNTAEISVPVDLKERKNLIVDYSVAPQLFSPNQDGKLESASFNFSLNKDLGENFNVSLQLINGAQTVVRTLSANNIDGGTHTLIWDGRAASGQLAADGTYQAILRAELVNHPTVIHQEMVSVVLDATAPMVQITEPAQNAYVSAALKIRGSITDTNLANYSLSLSGAAQRGIDGGQVNRTDYTFAEFDDLEDGAYTLAIQAQDKGQIETRTNIAFVVDKTPPVLTLEGASQDEVFGGNKPVLNLRGTIKEANVATWQLRYHTATPGSNNWTILAQGENLQGSAVSFAWPVGAGSGIADGNYLVSLFVVDKAGWEKESTIGIRVDNTAPNAAIAEPTEGSYVKKATAIKGTATDDNLATTKVAVSEGDCVQAFERKST
ncbi:MAG: hypothetical protein M0036_16340, partial [Desulfobacteraceae bacterium]|nr:hypothetical protein [Desulfobacteraceae bacterium]